MVLDAQNLVIPLVERYFSLFLGWLKVLIWGVAILSPAVSMLRSWLTSKSELRGAYRPWCRLTIPPPPLPSGIYFPVISYGFTATPRNPWISLEWPSRGLLPPSGPFWFGEPLALPVIDHCWGPIHPWSVLPVAWMPGPLIALPLGLK